MLPLEQDDPNKIFPQRPVDLPLARTSYMFDKKAGCKCLSRPFETHKQTLFLSPSSFPIHYTHKQKPDPIPVSNHCAARTSQASHVLPSRLPSFRFPSMLHLTESPTVNSSNLHPPSMLSTELLLSQISSLTHSLHLRSILQHTNEARLSCTQHVGTHDITHARKRYSNQTRAETQAQAPDFGFRTTSANSAATLVC